MAKDQKKSVVLYNVLFPIWFLIIFPMTWLVILPANFLIDSLVVIIAFKCLHMKEIKNAYRKSIIKVWLFGFTADLIGAGLLLMTEFMRGDWLIEYIAGPVSYNPWDNIYALGYVSAAVIVTGMFIYIFNRKISFKKTALTVKQKRIAAAALAAFTAPYVFFIPSQLTFSPRGEVHCFTSHLLSPGYDIFSIQESQKTYSHYPLLEYEKLETFEDALDTADRIRRVDKSILDREPDYIISLNISFRQGDWQKLAVWSDEKQVLLRSGDKWFRIEKKRTNEFRQLLKEASQKDGPPAVLLKDIFYKGPNKVFIFEDSQYKYYLMSEDEKVYAEFDDNYILDIGEALKLGIVTQEDLLQLPVEWVKETK